jgi:lipid A 3-O-deacylase
MQRVLWRSFGALVLSLALCRPALAQSILSELRFGVLAHDVPFLGSHKEPGADINGEVLFVSPIPGNLVDGVAPPLRWLLQPRPNAGFDANTAGYTSQFYFGLVWTADLFTDVLRPQDGVFFDFGFGPAFNNGEVDGGDNHKALGSHVLFHESVDIGYRITPRYSVSLYFEHSSNAGLASRNQGLNNAGVRFGIGF